MLHVQRAHLLYLRQLKRVDSSPTRFTIMMQLVVHLLGSVVFLLISSSLINSQNIDTKQPILREVNGLADGSLFGYSLVLHQTLANPSSMAEAINGAR